MDPYLTLAGTILAAILSLIGVRITAKKAAQATGETTGVTALTAAMDGFKSMYDRTQKDLEATKLQLNAVREDLQETKRHYDAKLEQMSRAWTASRQYVTILLSWIKEHLPEHEPPAPPDGYTD